ncbi:hypothetical protein Tco_0000550 [Tanacetum coccineum]
MFVFFVDTLLQNTMAEQNVPTQPPTRTDEQIIPRSQWLIIRKSNLLFNAQKIQKNPIFQISMDILSNTNFFRAFTASASVPAIYLQQFWNTMKYDEKTGIFYIRKSQFVPKVRLLKCLEWQFPIPDYEAIQTILLLSQVSGKGCSDRINKRKPLKQTAPAPDKETFKHKASDKIVKKRGKSPTFQLVDEDDEAQQESVPQEEGDDPDLELAKKMSLEAHQEKGEGEGYDTDMDIAIKLSLIHPFFCHKRKELRISLSLLGVIKLLMIQQLDPLPQPEDDKSEKVPMNLHQTSDSERTESETEAAAPKGNKDQGEVDSSRVTLGVSIPTNTVIRRNPESHSGSMSSMKNLDDTDNFRDQFLYDKPTEDDQEKSKVIEESDSTIPDPSHQTVTSTPPVIAPFTDVSSTKPSSLVTPPPINTEATTITTSLPEITPFIALQLRVARLEQEMSEVKKTDHSADVLASIKSQVPTVVDEYLGTKLDDALLKILERHTADLIKKYSVLPGPESIKNQESEKSPKEIIRIKREQGEEKQDSTYSIRSTDKVDLEEFDLKSALFKHMNKNKSANRNPANYHLYHALIEALIADEDAMDKEVPVLTGSNQGKSSKRRRHDSGASGSAQPPTKDDEQSSKKPRESDASASKQHPALTSTGWQITDTRDVVGSELKSEDTDNLTFPKVFDHYVWGEWISTSINTVEPSDREAVITQIANLSVNCGQEKDFKNLHPNDFEDLFLLNIQEKLNHLPKTDKTSLHNGRQKTCDKKTCDGTLTRVMEKLDHMVKDFHLFEYNKGMETRKWSEDDKRRSKDFITAIEKRLQIRRIFRSLESFVGGRIRDIDYRLINRTTERRTVPKDRPCILLYWSYKVGKDTYPILLSFTHCGNKSILRVLRIILVILPEHPSETMVFHNEDGNPARANIKQALGYLKDGDGDGNSQHLRYQRISNITYKRRYPTPIWRLLRHRIFKSVDGPPVMPDDPYAYVVAAFQAPPSLDYVPGLEEPEQAPPLPEFVPEPVYLEFMQRGYYSQLRTPLTCMLLSHPLLIHQAIFLSSIPRRIRRKMTMRILRRIQLIIPPIEMMIMMRRRRALRRDEADDEEEDEDDEKEEEEHLAPVDSTLIAFLLLIMSPTAEGDRAIPSLLLPLILSPLPVSPLLPVSSPPLPTSPTYPLGYRAAMIRLRAETPSTSHSPPLGTPQSGTPLILPIPIPTSSLSLAATTWSKQAAVCLPTIRRVMFAFGLGKRWRRAYCAPTARQTRGFRADYGFVATLDDEIRRDPERYVGYGITDT